MAAILIGAGRLDVSMEIPRGSTFVAVSGPGGAAFPLRRRVSYRESARYSVIVRFQALQRRLAVSACL